MTILNDIYKYKYETKNIEFKQFCIKLDIYKYITNIDINNIILTGEWKNKFKNLIKDNILLYLKIYVLPFMLGCINENIEGKIIIGIDDSGKITGIPYKSKISKKEICKNIKLLLNNNVKTDNNIDNIIKNIKVSIIKLKIDENLINDNYTEIYRDSIKIKERYDKNIILYNRKLKIWEVEYNLYRTNLNNIINNKITRIDLINFIESKKKFVNEKNIKYINDIIILLRSNKYIDIKHKCHSRFNIIKKIYNYILSRNAKYGVSYYKNDINHLAFWICEYQEYMINKLKKNKPIKPIRPIIINPIIFFSKLTDLTYKFINNNINYYIIEINIKKSNFKPDLKLLDNGNYKYYKRIIELGIPSTKKIIIKKNLNIFLIYIIINYLLTCVFIIKSNNLV